MNKARNQGEQEQYCPINLDYIFAEDDPLLPWLEHREKQKDAANSEEENYPDLVRRTTRTHQEPIIEIEENSSSATQSDHRSGNEGTDDDDDDDDDDDGDDGDGGGGDGSGGGDRRIGGTSETIVPSTYPYPYTSQSQSTTTSADCEKSPILQEEEGEEEDEEKEDSDVEQPIMDVFQRQPPWPTGFPDVYAQTSYPAYPPQPPSHPVGADSYTYFFGYPPQYGYGYGQFNTNNNDNDDAEEPPRHSFWW